MRAASTPSPAHTRQHQAEHLHLALTEVPTSAILAGSKLISSGTHSAKSGKRSSSPSSPTADSSSPPRTWQSTHIASYPTLFSATSSSSSFICTPQSRKALPHACTKLTISGRHQQKRSELLRQIHQHKAHHLHHLLSKALETHADIELGDVGKSSPGASCSVIM